MNVKSRAILRIILILLLIIVLLKLCLIFLWPFFLSFIVVIIVEPFVEGFMRFGVNRRYSVTISFILVLLITVFITSYLYGYAYSHLTAIFHKVPEVLDIIGKKFKFFNQDLINYNNIFGTIESLFSDYRSKILDTLLSTVNGVVNIVIILMTAFFLSLDLDILLLGFNKLIPYEYLEIFNNVAKKVLTIVQIEIKLMIFTTLQMVLGLYILRVEEPLTIGIICGILDLLPIVGPTIVFIPWIAYELITKNLFLGLGLMFLFLLLQINRQVMHIKYVGNNLKIRPFSTIFALYIGVILFGVWGVILGPLLIILVQELYNNLYEGRKVL